MRTSHAILLLTGLTLFSCASGPSRVESGEGASNRAAQFTDSQAATAIREALDLAVRPAVAVLARPDGFAANPFARIPFPPEASFAEKTLRDLGMGPSLDKFVLQLNRAAEASTPAAEPALIKAAQTMPIEDAPSILQATPDGAARKLREHAESSLAMTLRPTVIAKLKEQGALALWETITARYNKLPWTEEDMDADLPSYVTTHVIDTVFARVAEEEKRIRRDSSAQTTDLLRQVFGGSSGG